MSNVRESEAGSQKLKENLQTSDFGLPTGYLSTNYLTK